VTRWPNEKPVPELSPPIPRSNRAEGSIVVKHKAIKTVHVLPDEAGMSLVTLDREEATSADEMPPSSFVNVNR